MEDDSLIEKQQENEESQSNRTYVAWLLAFIELCTVSFT